MGMFIIMGVFMNVFRSVTVIVHMSVGFVFHSPMYPPDEIGYTKDEEEPGGNLPTVCLYVFQLSDRDAECNAYSTQDDGAEHVPGSADQCYQERFLYAPVPRS